MTILRAPAYWNIDLGLQRNLRFSATTNLSVRLEVFNALNNINLGNPAVAIDIPATAGRITSMAGSPRQIQLGFRLAY
jgi:hypothetical protein